MSSQYLPYPGPPTHGIWEVGQQTTDINGNQWLCTVRGFASGTAPPAAFEQITEPPQAGSSGKTPVLLGIGGSAIGGPQPGAAEASFVNEGLATMTPIPSLFDGAPLGYWTALAASDGVLLAVVQVATDATFLGHDLNFVYRSTDGGAHWTGISTPWDGDIDNGLYGGGIAFGAAGEVLLIGSNASANAFVGRSTDAGLTWTDITADTPLAAGFPFTNGSVAFDGTVWYLTLNPVPVATGLWTSTDPTTLLDWTPRITTLDGEVVKFAAVAPGAAFAAGGSGTVDLVVSTDHGATWTDNTNPFDGTGAPDAMVTDGAGNWLAWNAADTGIQAMVQSLDNGSTWGTPVALPAFATTVSSCFLSGTGWVTVWGDSYKHQAPSAGSPSNGAVIVYSAPVADPLVITPTGYNPDNIYAPLALVPV